MATKGAGLFRQVDLARLADLDTEALRRLWSQLFGIEPVQRVSRELLTRAVSYRLQENAEGGLSRRTARALDRLAAEFGSSGSIAVETGPGIRAGTRLVREWQGRVHEVIVLEDHYLWKGTRYRSLSEIARLITGARWSGPRFFGTGKPCRGDKRKRVLTVETMPRPARQATDRSPHHQNGSSLMDGATLVRAGDE